MPTSVQGTKAIPENADESVGDFLSIDILKLHGSLNFPKKRLPDNFLVDIFAKPLNDPDILPPVSNKLAGKGADKIWKSALAHLRSARNIVFVGYSLPKTDIYMQYFLKAALGPNLNLDKITVFDPVMFGNPGNRGQKMIDRFESCFSENLRRRINFAPTKRQKGTAALGTTEHFVDILANSPSDIFF